MTGRARRRGQTLVEFSVVVLLTVVMLLFIVELGRMVLVYTTLANAARAGTRYAVVHGSTRAVGTGVDNASGPAEHRQVDTIVKNFASAGLLTTSRLVIQVTYNPSNTPGSNVVVSVVYPYDPLTTYFTRSLRLGSSATGVIAF